MARRLWSSIFSISGIWFLFTLIIAIYLYPLKDTSNAWWDITIYVEKIDPTEADFTSSARYEYVLVYIYPGLITRPRKLKKNQTLLHCVFVHSYDEEKEMYMCTNSQGQQNDPEPAVKIL